MALHIRNIQTKIIFSLKQFEKDLNVLRSAAGIQHHDLGIVCSDTHYMKQLHKLVNINDQERVPSMISIPTNQGLGQLFAKPDSRADSNVGDVVLNIPTIFVDSKEHYLSIYSALAMSSAQGISELLVPGDNGADHQKKLLDKECDILYKYNRLTGSSLPLPEELPHLEAAKL